MMLRLREEGLSKDAQQTNDAIICLVFKSNVLNVNFAIQNATLSTVLHHLYTTSSYTAIQYSLLSVARSFVFIIIRYSWSKKCV